MPCCWCGGSGCARRSPRPVPGLDKSHKRAWGAWAGGRALLLVSRLPLGARSGGCRPGAGAVLAGLCLPRAGPAALPPSVSDGRGGCP